LLHDLPADHDRHAVADQFQIAQQVAVDQHRLAAAAELQQHVADLPAGQRVDAVGGLVEDDQIGVVDHRLGQPDALGHALGIGGDLVVGPLVHADDGEELAGAVLAGGLGDAVQAGDERQHLLAGEVAGEAVVFGQVADARQRRPVADGPAQHGAADAGGPDERQQNLDEGGLARPVGPEQAEDLAGPHLQVHPAQRVDLPAVAFFDAGQVNRVLAGGTGGTHARRILSGRSSISAAGGGDCRNCPNHHVNHHVAAMESRAVAKVRNAAPMNERTIQAGGVGRSRLWRRVIIQPCYRQSVCRLKSQK
jgi:hypothetical protein